ncbi:MAG: 2OG-Fe(II) oxygenase [Waterburya sp.]
MYFFDDNLCTLIRKIKNRFINKIFQLKFFNYYQERYYKNQILNHQNNFSEVFAYYQDIDLQLENQGICITHLDNLKINSSKQLMQSCLNVMPSLKARKLLNHTQYLLIAESQKIIEYPEIFTWGLEQKLIATISKYLKLPVAYHGAYLRRDIANDIVNKSRLWHLDKEDRKMVKIIIYLKDVDQKNGAFQYIPKRFTSDLIHKLKYNYEYLSNEKVERFLSSSEWIACEGKTGTVIFVDTANIFHRGLVPQTSDRWSIFFDYTSAFPLRPYYCKSSLPLKDLLAFASSLSAQQQESVFWNRNLKQALKRFENKV